MALHRLVASVLVVGSLAVTAPPAFAQADSDSYFEFLMARRLEGTGDFAAAQAALDRALQASPTSAELRGQVASFYLRRSQPDEAEKAAKAGLAIDESNTEAHRALGLVYAGYADAGTGARANSPEIRTYLNDAITHLERAATGAPGGDLVLYFTLGRLYLRTNQAQKAVDSMSRVVAVSPGNARARAALAQAYVANNNLPAAIDTLEVIVDDEPSVAAVLGQYQEQAGRFRDAAASYTKALEVNPMSREIKARRIAALFGANDLPGAAAAAADAQRQHPEDARFPRLRARALFDGGSRNDGLTILEAAARTFPKDSNTLYQLADMYKDAGRNPDAEKTLRQLLTVEPANANALNYLGYLLALKGDRLDEAIDLVRKALVAEPDNGAFMDSLGWAYFRKGDLGEAEKYLGQAATRLPKNSEVQDHLGDVLAKRGRLPDAVDAWTRALDGDGSDIDRAEIQKKINDARSKIRK
ncbi:MAG TPA: tetratricopeptide repeat protein [Vicinamibacterales bacterium]|jgi:tetratricopeptide (TPR) repeat protein|nr:tetratricopeptide repeat protein [Vicinamibacterales bacterium]